MLDTPTSVRDWTHDYTSTKHKLHKLIDALWLIFFRFGDQTTLVVRLSAFLGISGDIHMGIKVHAIGIISQSLHFNSDFKKKTMIGGRGMLQSLYYVIPVPEIGTFSGFQLQ